MRRALNSLPGLYLLNTSSSPPTQVVTTNMSPVITNVPWGEGGRIFWLEGAASRERGPMCHHIFQIFKRNQKLSCKILLWQMLLFCVKPSETQPNPTVC